MHLQTIKFKRVQDGPEENGILVNEGFGPILDTKGQVVSEVWDYRKTYDLVIYLPWHDINKEDERDKK